jgi:hypothetical protein
LLTEEENVIASVLEVFKKHNPRWEGVNVIISDKAMTERNAMKYNGILRLLVLKVASKNSTSG